MPFELLLARNSSVITEQRVQHMVLQNTGSEYEYSKSKSKFDGEDAKETKR